MKEIKVLGNENYSQIKWNKIWVRTFYNTDFEWEAGKNQVERTPNYPASKTLVVILGLKYKAYCNSALQNKLSMFCV